MPFKKVLSINGKPGNKWNGLAIFVDHRGIYWIADEYSTRKASKALLKQLGIKHNKDMTLDTDQNI